MIKNACQPTLFLPSCIALLINIDKNEFKLAPKLTKSCINLSHYDKMKVGPAYALLDHSVCIELEYYVKIGKNDQKSLTTAWFIKSISGWFNIMTSRSKFSSLSYANMNAYEGNVNFLENFKELFPKIKFGDRAVWKSVQTGVLLAIY